MIEVKNLSKHYGPKKAVDDITFTVQKGEILGFLGPNGAGKSTTMNMLTGYISSTYGNAYINGIDILEDPLNAKQQIGYLPEMPPLYVDMTVKEYLNFVYDLKKCTEKRQEHIKKICNLVKISDVYERVIKNLSKGYKQRVGIAQALIGNPPVLILDEPTVGLDPKQIIEIRSLIKMLGRQHTVILSSHILSEIQAVCDRVVIINNGQIAADDTTDNITRALSNDHKLTARIDGKKEEMIKLISAFKGVISVTADMEREPGVYEYEIETEEGSDIRRELFKRLAERNCPILALGTNALTLEDVFLKITKDGAKVSPIPNKEAEPNKEIDSSKEAEPNVENNSEELDTKEDNEEVSGGKE